MSHYTLEKVQPRVISFEEQVASIRQHLADIYERNQNWREAASVLVGIPLETGQKYVASSHNFINRVSANKNEWFIRKIGGVYLKSGSEMQNVYLSMKSVCQFNHNQNSKEKMKLLETFGFFLRFLYSSIVTVFLHLQEMHYSNIFAWSREFLTPAAFCVSNNNRHFGFSFNRRLTSVFVKLHLFLCTYLFTRFQAVHH